MPYSSRCPEEKFDFARRMRNAQTHCEQLLWAEIRAHRLGVKFRRQSVILGYIADFYCPSRRLVIEVDGESHRGREHLDAERDRILRRYGVTTIRFSNGEVLRDLEGCVTRLRNIIVRTPHSERSLPR